MNSENKKYTGIFTTRTSFYLWTILFLVIIVAFLDYRFSIPGFALFIVLVIHNFRSNYKRQKEITRYIENLTLNIESASKDTLLNFPLPLIVVELDGTVVWYNSLSRSVFGDEKLFEKNIESLVKGLKPAELVYENSTISRNVEINYRHYRVLGNFVKTAETSEMGSYILLLYFIDNTELVKLKEKYDNERITVGIVMIDNYDELMQSLDDPGPPQLLAEIEKRINSWLGFTEGIVQKYERDKYLVIIEKRSTMASNIALWLSL
jgi:c-di-AMP phosphodiesterase-like protein